MYREHWDHVYKTKAPDQVSWYRPHLETSLALIELAAGGLDAAILDAGAGESTLVDDLLDRGYTNITALDISPAAIAFTKARLGVRAEKVRWIVGDITHADLPQNFFDVWHDRAVFHFLTAPEHRCEYVRQVTGSVKPRGHVIIGAFGPDGPEKCSGLPVVRYDASSMHAEFGRGFRLIDHLSEDHQTPFGTVQQFVWCFCRVE